MKVKTSTVRPNSSTMSNLGKRMPGAAQKQPRSHGGFSKNLRSLFEDEETVERRRGSSPTRTRGEPSLTPPFISAAASSSRAVTPCPFRTPTRPPAPAPQSQTLGQSLRGLRGRLQSMATCVEQAAAVADIFDTLDGTMETSIGNRPRAVIQPRERSRSRQSRSRREQEEVARRRRRSLSIESVIYVGTSTSNFADEQQEHQEQQQQQQQPQQQQQQQQQNRPRIIEDNVLKVGDHIAF